MFLAEYNVGAGLILCGIRRGRVPVERNPCGATLPADE